jgi:uncharacterized protein (DUF924 family)
VSCENSDDRIGTLLDYWFDGEPAEAGRPDRLMRKWFAGSADQDRELAQLFGELARSAANGELDPWGATPHGRLALIILLDQLPRNLFRGTARAFARDPMALELCLGGLDRGQDRTLHPLERLFFCMPLQHAESREIQARSIEEFENLASSADAGPMASALRSAADYAREHREIIERFGRFPHRNRTLGRPSTEEELEFLNSGGPTYGQ